jgi:serine/threonine-protein kinase
VVKVLDFGLAKLLERPAGAGHYANDLTASPTLTSPAVATGAGIILGTAAYMSPEQARGKTIDRRTDTWAFGCVLYEMLTRRRAFEGEDVSDTLAAVLRGEPDWPALPPSVPAPIAALLKRCLQRDRRDRVGDVATALTIAEDAVSLSRGASPAGGPGTERAGWRVAGIAAAKAVLIAAVSGTAVWMAVRPDPPRVSRLTITPPPTHALTLNGQGRNVAISPDGSRIAYVGPGGTLLVRKLDELEPVVLVRGDGPVAPFFSPDGQWIGYFPSNRNLRKVQVTGGPTVEIGRVDNASPGGATWAENGAVVFATTNRLTGLSLLAPGAAGPTVLTVPDRKRGEIDHLWPEFLPSGRAVLFTIRPASAAPGAYQVAVLDLDTKRYTVVVPGASHAHYVPTGHLVYAAAGGLRAVRFDADRNEPIGDSFALMLPVMTNQEGAADFDVASDGTLVYVPADVAVGQQLALDRSLVWVGRDGKAEPIGAAPTRTYQYPRLSPDGSRVLLDIRDQDNDIWLWDLQRQTLSNLTANPALDRFPVWTPDGRHFIFVSDRDGGMFAMYRQAADGTSAAERLSDSTVVQQTPTAVTPDGRQLVFDLSDDVMTMALDGNRRFTALVQTPFAERRAALSPDGRWLAYHADDSSRIEVYVRPFPAVNTGKAQVSTAGGVQPWWSPTGSELFYFSPSGELMRVPVKGGSTWSAGVPTVLFDARSFLFNPIGTAASTLDVSADGRRFLMIRSAGASAATDASPATMVVVQNWFEELKRLGS